MENGSKPAGSAIGSLEALVTLRATALSEVGYWMASTRVESTESIIKNYLKPATEALSIQIENIETLLSLKLLANKSNP